MPFPKFANSRNQPLRRKRGQDADCQHAAGIHSGRPVGRVIKLIERIGERRQIGLAGLGEEQLSVPPDEQIHPEPLFQGLDLVADRRLRDGQFLGRTGKAQMPGRGLESAQSVEWRKMTSHPWIVPKLVP